MLTVGTDTYITTAEADDLLYGDQGYGRWTTLTEPEKEGYLKAAALHIELLRYAGRKHSIFQEMSFPRDMNRDVPAAVKRAQALEALALTDAQAQSRRSLQEQGVQSISLGKASESYKDMDSGRRSPVCSMDAAGLLRPYLLGSAAIV
ncbi:DnaT-like ssDNA-binding protein [Anaeromassilibacillus senegalensis]|uniref:DnaT-like ssDNA-binding protein n=1 Tax=Anaeromassilibacillus senegalensis TaxID=1673717 RepID=UPI0006806050|nr:DnaT-like ssDNA-binding protein [Anaeromassilibacillus senegalensis]